MNTVSLPKEHYISGDIFKNPFPAGHRAYILHIYPDPQYGNNWVGAICAEDEELNDAHHIVINKDIMTRRLCSGEDNVPYITRDEVIKLLSEIFAPYVLEHGTFSFTR